MIGQGAPLVEEGEGGVFFCSLYDGAVLLYPATQLASELQHSAQMNLETLSTVFLTSLFED